MRKPLYGLVSMETCGHPLAALGWAAGAFAAMAIAAEELASMTRALGGGLGAGEAALATCAAAFGLPGVWRIARRLGAHEGARAQTLLWSTTLAYGVLASIALLGCGVRADALPDTIVNIAWSALAALAIGAVLAHPRTRAILFSLIVLGPCLVLTPSLWAAALACGALIAVSVEVALRQARTAQDMPAPALAACCVAGVVAVPGAIAQIAIHALASGWQ